MSRGNQVIWRPPGLACPARGGGIGARGTRQQRELRWSSTLPRPQAAG